MAGITINADPRIKRLCDQYGTRRVIAAALEVVRRLSRGERKGFLHYEEDIARFASLAEAEGFVRHFRADLVTERGSYA